MDSDGQDLLDQVRRELKLEMFNKSWDQYCANRDIFGPDEGKQSAKCFSYVQEKPDFINKGILPVLLISVKLDEIFGLIQMKKTNAIRVAEIVNSLTLKYVREVNEMYNKKSKTTINIYTETTTKKKKSTELERLIKRPKYNNDDESYICYYDNTMMINKHSIMFNDCRFDSVVYILELIYDYLTKNTTDTMYFYITNCNKIIITKNAKHYIFDVTQFGVHVALNYL